MHKHIPSISPEEYARRVMERRAVLRVLDALPAQPDSRGVCGHEDLQWWRRR